MFLRAFLSGCMLSNTENTKCEHLKTLEILGATHLDVIMQIITEHVN